MRLARDHHVGGELQLLVEDLVEELLLRVGREGRPPVDVRKSHRRGIAEWSGATRMSSLKYIDMVVETKQTII